MKISAAWLNSYLDHPARPEEQAELLTRAGFPIETSEDIPNSGGDVRLDVEITSNRGDCLSHVGLARELAAVADRQTRLPSAKPQATDRTPASSVVSVTNHEKQRCPLYTARIIRGVKVAPSPDWLVQRLRALGQIPRNNLVDLSNFVLFELGQPTHVFDLGKLKGPAIVIRMAKPDEPFLPIGEGAAPVKLSADDLVIADAERAVAIAGVKGGAETAVTHATTNILIETATFDPVTVRHTSRRLGITSDSQFRFERGVAAGSVQAAADRLTALILEVCGGELCEGTVCDGAPIPELRQVTMRLSKCETTLGLPIAHARVLRWLSVLGFDPRQDGDIVHCTVPAQRNDIEREIDLIEEVCRLHGYDDLPVEPSVRIRITAPQPPELARRAIRNALVGMGFVETTTHSLISEADAAPFAPTDGSLLRVAHDMSRGEPILRPSIVPSLLRVRRHNLRHGVNHLRLFEGAATFWADNKGQPHEANCITLLADIEDASLGLRPLRGVVEQLARIMRGPTAIVELTRIDSHAWLAPGAAVTIDGETCGVIGVLDSRHAQQFDLQSALVAELELQRWFPGFPPDAEAHALPAFPPIERDISAIVDESMAWERIERCVEACRLPMLEAIEFVAAFRGKQIGAGKKSVTLRLRFRAPDRTLQHHEIDPAAEVTVAALRDTLGAEIRETAKA